MLAYIRKCVAMCTSTSMASNTSFFNTMQLLFILMSTTLLTSASAVGSSDIDVMDSVRVIALNSASGRCFEPTMSLPTTQVEQLISYRLKYCVCKITMGAAHEDQHKGRLTFFRNVVSTKWGKIWCYDSSSLAGADAVPPERELHSNYLVTACVSSVES